MRPTVPGQVANERRRRDSFAIELNARGGRLDVHFDVERGGQSPWNHGRCDWRGVARSAVRASHRENQDGAGHERHGGPRPA